MKLVPGKIYDEYLLIHRKRPQGRFRMQFHNRLKFGNVVLIKNTLKPRPYWVLGGVRELISRRDGVVRAARVKQGGTVQA